MRGARGLARVSWHRTGAKASEEQNDDEKRGPLLGRRAPLPLICIQLCGDVKGEREKEGGR